MNIDLLMTKQGEAGIVSDRPFEDAIEEVHLSAEGHLAFHFGDASPFEANIPLEQNAVDALSQLLELHYGLLEDGVIADVRQVPLILDTDAGCAGQARQLRPRMSAAAFEMFMRRCVSGQAVHRDNPGDEDKASGILGGVSPALVRFLPSLARRQTYEAAPQIDYLPPSPSLGGGGSARSRSIPDDPDKVEKTPLPAGFMAKIKSQLQNERGLPVLSHEEIAALLAPLNALTGLESVKGEVSDLVHLLHVQALRQQHGLPTSGIVLHSIFSGPPGTGKTTVARLFGEILKKLGYLSRDHVVERDQASLIGQYVGETPDIMRQAVIEADGGVLFIDEAYMLNDDRYGREAIGTLLKMMEDRADRFVVVCAGYPDEMDAFLKSNPGLKSRFPRVLSFETCKSSEMADIFRSTCTVKGYVAGEETIAALVTYLNGLDNETINAMGNARMIRNMFEGTILRQARRLIGARITDAQGMSIILPEDLAFPKTEDSRRRAGFL